MFSYLCPSFDLLLIWHPFPALTDSFLCCFFLELELWKIKPQTPAPLTSSLAPAQAHPSGQHLSSSITLGWIAARDRKIRNYVKMLWIQQRGLIPITAPLPFPSSCHVISIPSLPPALGLSQKLLCGFCRAHFFLMIQLIRESINQLIQELCGKELCPHTPCHCWGSGVEPKSCRGICSESHCFWMVPFLKISNGLGFSSSGDPTGQGQEWPWWFLVLVLEQIHPTFLLEKLAEHGTLH